MSLICRWCNQDVRTQLNGPDGYPDRRPPVTLRDPAERQVGQDAQTGKEKVLAWPEHHMHRLCWEQIMRLRETPSMPKPKQAPGQPQGAPQQQPGQVRVPPGMRPRQ